MYSYRKSYNELPTIQTSTRPTLASPNLVKNLQRGFSLNNISVPNLSKSTQFLLNSPSESAHVSPVFFSSPKLSNQKLPSLPSLSATVKSSRPHGVVKAYCANTHKGIVRSVNEDRVMIISKISRPEMRRREKWPVCSFFAVYDGHMGKECCGFLRDNLHSFIINDPDFPADPSKALVNSFAKAESTFTATALESHTKSGSCAIIILIVSSTCYLANLGDSRAVLSESKLHKITQLSTDHSPHEETERKRISLTGAEIFLSKHPNNSKQIISRVMPGGISVSRCFGDVDAKVKELGGVPGALIAVPEIKVFKIHSDSDFILIGSDGLFEKMENREAIEMVWRGAFESAENEVSGKIAKGVERIMVEAMVRGASDNMTAVVVAFKNFCNELEICV